MATNCGSRRNLTLRISVPVWFLLEAVPRNLFPDISRSMPCYAVFQGKGPYVAIFLIDAFVFTLDNDEH